VDVLWVDKLGRWGATPGFGAGAPALGVFQPGVAGVGRLASA